MKKSKKKNGVKAPSPAVLAAQERNQKKFEERKKKAQLRNLYNRIIMQFAPMLEAFQLGINGGGMRSRFSFPSIEIEDKKFKRYLNLPIGKCQKKYDIAVNPVLTITNCSQQRDIDDNLFCTAENQALLDEACYRVIPKLTLYTCMKYQIAVLMHLLLDFEVIALKYDYEFTDEANAFLNSIVLLVNQLFKNDTKKEQKYLTACYWLVWEKFMQMPLSEHPNNAENILIPDIEAHLLFFRATKKFSKPMFITFGDHRKENKDRMDSEVKRGFDDLRDRGILKINPREGCFLNHSKYIRAVV